MRFPTISADPTIQDAYEGMRRRGESHNLAEMLALQAVPQIVTDNTFLTGHANGSQFEKRPEMGDFYRRRAEAGGQNVKGKVYLSGLAEYPGDPRAWVSGRGDVQKVCEERGYGCDGAVTVKRDRSVEPPPPVDVADDIVDEHAQMIVAKEPERGRTPEKKAELKEQVRQRLKPHWAKG